ncbi:MAG: SPOR domain-containing protein [Candidatus Omnitrophica bacterium]|nr:SPOR domain-containing protein [Candidatus Omnitrophota bacterium]
MASGKIKDAWPIWALVIAGIIIIFLAVNQNKVEKEAVDVGELLTSESSALSSYSPDLSGTKAAAVVADPVVSPAIVATSETGTQVTYAIQLYSFKEQSRADAMAGKLKDGGVPAYVQMSDLGDKGVWYRVRTGSFPSSELAQAALAVIRKEHKDSIVVKEKK